MRKKMILVSEFKNKNLTKEILDRVRLIDGFPIAKDEDIIALSDPPYYTACPNPFIKDFIEKYGKPYDREDDDYYKEPYTSDISVGKNDPIYMAHSYSTKVPPKAIMRYILHYTKSGDIIFDGFSGTGMTGIAAYECGSPDKDLKTNIEAEMPHVEWGNRKAILCDLSPLAAFIGYNYNTPINLHQFIKESERILTQVETEYGWMYETVLDINGKSQHIADFKDLKRTLKGRIIYVVWSDVYTCPECAQEILYWNFIYDEKNKKNRDNMHCLNCGVLLTKNSIKRVWENTMDDELGQIIKQVKKKAIFMSYVINRSPRSSKKRFKKKMDNGDLKLLKKINDIKKQYWYPTDKFMFIGKKWGDTWRAGYHAGITHVHHFYTKRNFLILSAIFSDISKIPYKRLKNFLLCWFTSSHSRLHKLNRYMPRHNRHVGPLSGTLYLSPLQAEISPFYFIKVKLRRHSTLKLPSSSNIITTQSTTNLQNIPDNSVDYIFTDPPFGSNLMYSELNFLLESWLKVFTNNKCEAIVNKVQGKGLPQYQKLMEQCFKENHRIIKPGRWMTVEFHNSRNNVWIAIQEALMRAGFIVADVRTLDKQKGTTKQLSYVSGTVKQDLIISAYKPNEGLEANFKLKGGTDEGVWAFVRHHLKHLPVYVEKEGSVEVVAERQNFLLFDRMVAFHVQRGISVPISASEFYTGLKQRFPIRDDMYFSVDQVHEYDRKRMKAKRVEQASLFVHDERSAIQWLRRELSQEPQTYQDIMPNFLQELYKEKHEDLPELSKILEQNFLQDGESRWYIPDSSREADLEKLREKALLREFQEYKEAKGRLRLFRSEAVRTGFSKCWQEGDYETIVEVAEKLPIKILQEEPTLLMYYDNAIILTQR